MIPIEIKEVQGGLQMIYHFSNGYGASVIQHEGSYGGLSSKWELAVITNFSVENIDENVQFDITAGKCVHFREPRPREVFSNS